MTKMRLSATDPRTVARDIPGIFDALFPQLVPGLVMHLNREAFAITGCEPVSLALISASKLQHAMLFEVAIAAGEQLLANEPINWEHTLEIAVRRQRRYFDAKLPRGLDEADKEVATLVADNLVRMLGTLQKKFDGTLTQSPRIPGYQWISSGTGDFSIDRRLIEVKCTNKAFSSSDYRQVMMYWLLSYAASVEGSGTEWSEIILLNPRLNTVIKISVGDLIDVIAAGRSKVDLLQLFASMASSHNAKLLGQI